MPHDHIHHHAHGDGGGSEDFWSGEEYLKKPGVAETAVVSHESVVHALQSAGVSNDDISNMNLLEIGCGPGAVTSLYAPTFRSVHAIDTSRSMLVTLSGRLPEKTTFGIHALSQESAELFTSYQDMTSPTTEQPNRQLPPPRDRFDVAVANLVIHHVDDLDAFMRGVYGLLKPFGWVVFTEIGKEPLRIETRLKSVWQEQERGKHDGSANAPEHFHPLITERSGCDLLEKYGFVDTHAEIRGKLPVTAVETDWPPCLIIRGRKPTGRHA